MEASFIITTLWDAYTIIGMHHIIKMRNFLIIIIVLLSFTACGIKKPLSENIVSDILGTSSENIISDITEPPSENDIYITSEICMMINNMWYRQVRFSVTYDTDKLADYEYIGELTGEVPRHRAPINNMTANFPFEGNKIYKIDDESLVVKYERIINDKTYTMNYREMKIDKSDKARLVRIEDNLFSFPKSEYNDAFNLVNDFDNCPKEYDLDKAEYIGIIIEQFDLEYKIPTEHLTSNLYPVGSKVYRIDESISIVCYEKNNEKMYSVGRIFELD